MEENVKEVFNMNRSWIISHKKKTTKEVTLAVLTEGENFGIYEIAQNMK